MANGSELKYTRQIPAFDEANRPCFISVNFYTTHQDDTQDERKIKISYPNGAKFPYSVITLISMTFNDNILSMSRLESNNVYSPYVELCIRDLLSTKSHLYPNNPMSISFLINKLVDGVKWLHEHNIFHAYLNPEDIYLENYYTVKVGGFYFSEILPDKHSRIPRGNRTLYYEPSPADENTLGLKYDIWCLGLVIYELILKLDARDFLNQNLNLGNDAWDANLPRGSLLDSYRYFLTYDYSQRPMINDDIVLENLASINANTKETVNLFKKDWTFAQINNLTIKVSKNGEIRCLKLRSFRKERTDFQRELYIFKDTNVHHELFAATYLGDVAYIGEPFIWLFTEFAKNGCLKSKIKSLKSEKKKFEQAKLEDFIRQLIKILSYMHNANVMHRNLKTSNVLLFEKNGRIILKFTDFYASKSNVGQQGINYTEIPKSPYTAPELFDKNPIYGKPVDVWSVGCIIYEMDNIQRRCYNGLSIPTILPDFLLIENPLAKKLCQKMIVLNPDDRATVEELIQLI